MIPPPKSGILSYRAQGSLVCTPAREGEHRPADQVTRPMTDQHLSLLEDPMRIWHTPATAWRRWLFLAFPPLAALALNVALAIPAEASPVVQTNIHIPISAVLSDPCTGANVTLSGDDHLKSQVNFDEGAAGMGVHAHVHGTIHVTGTDDQGNVYIGDEEGETLINGRVDADGQIVLQEEASILDTFVLVSQGAAPNLTKKLIAHVTLNPNGTITAFVENMTMTCQG